MLITDMEPMTIQSTDAIKVHLGQSMRFIGAIYRSMYERLLLIAEMKSKAVS